MCKDHNKSIPNEARTNGSEPNSSAPNTPGLTMKEDDHDELEI